MKKRILSMLLAVMMCLTMIPVSDVSAADNSKVYSLATATTDATQAVSQWAINELVLGSTYGFYPEAWNEKVLTGPISQSQLRVLLAGLRSKILDTNCVTNNPNPDYSITKNITVAKVLDTYYGMLSSLEFSIDLDLKGKKAVDYFKEIGIYTGANGELALKDTCSMEQAIVMGTRLITFVFDKFDAASKGFLWQIKKGNNTVYMLGSIHMADSKTYPLSKKILAAYQSSNALVEEIDFTDTTGPTILNQYGMYSDGTTLKDHVSKEIYDKVVALAAKYQITEQVIAMFKPWYLYLSFTNLAATVSGGSSDAGLSASLGIDLIFTTNAVLAGKPIMQVEGYEYQAKMLDSFSDALEETLLKETVDQINSEKGITNSVSDNVDEMLDLWHKGDLENFKKMNSLSNEVPEGIDKSEKALMDEYMDKMFTQRDKGMAEYIDKLLKADGSSTYFVVVGSFHYVSDYSVLDILKAKGYEVTRVQ